MLLADRRTRVPPEFFSLIDRRTMAVLLGFGAMVAFGQLADFLYAPVDYILVNRLIDPVAVATYAPAIQIDAGLLLLVGALATVLLPKTAMAHAAGDVATVRRYYIRGTLASLGILLLAALAVWLAAPYIFRLWLGDEMRSTQVILPLVLLHTVIGGSGAVGRSVLLGMGRVKPFTLSVLAAGVSNVILSFSFVYYLDMGLHGIVLGTILSVTARAVLWQPWYVLRLLRPGNK
jgi:O-antigen/teichoic acid export membrane protein